MKKQFSFFFFYFVLLNGIITGTVYLACTPKYVAQDVIDSQYDICLKKIQNKKGMRKACVRIYVEGIIEYETIFFLFYDYCFNEIQFKNLF